MYGQSCQAILCYKVLGWLAGIYYMLGGGGGGVMGVKMCWIQIKMGLWSVDMIWGFARPIRANGAHPS